MDYLKIFWRSERTKEQVENVKLFRNNPLLIYFSKNKEKKIFLTGLWDKNIDVNIPAKTKILAIRFKPISAEYILEKKIASLLNSMITVSTDNYKFIETLDTNYQNLDLFVSTNILKIQLILGTEKGIDTRKEKLFNFLFSNNGVILIKEISERVFWSNRQIRRYFKENYGLSIKKYANILRINSTYKDLAKGEHYPQTEYFDQSHFIKEIKKYTGVKPKTLIKNKNDRFLQLSTKQIT